MTVHVQILYRRMFVFLPGKYLGMAGSYDRCIFNLKKETEQHFHSSCTVLHFHKQYMGVPVPPHPCDNLVWSIFLILAILICIMYVTVISLMTNDIEHLSHAYLPPIYFL